MFGQVTWPLTSTLAATVGGRITFNHSNQDTAIDGVTLVPRSTRDGARFSGTAGLDWHTSDRFSVFARYQQGDRPGGLGIGLSDAGFETIHFKSDRLDMYEVGLRFGDRSAIGLSGRISVFFAYWRNIQADLIAQFAIPYTTNIGNGTVNGLDGDITWRPAAGVTVSLSAFFNDSGLSRPAEGFTVSDRSTRNNISRNLPNVARAGARVAATSEWPITDHILFRTSGALRYVGRSHLGFGSLLDIPQGNYVISDLAGQVDFGRFAVNLSIDNVMDARGNTFSYGNPFALTKGDQITPNRPRTVRLGLNAQF